MGVDGAALDEADDGREPMAGVERSARRWMRAYPAAWRADREDEVVGVLLDGAKPGQQRVALADGFDLARAGLAQRWRGAGAVPPPRSWAEAVRVVAVLGTVLLAARGARQAAVWLRMGLQQVSGGADAVWPMGELMAGWPGRLAWFVAAIAVLVRRPRAAALAASVGVLADAWFILELVRHHRAFLAEGQVPWLALAIIVAVLLAVARPSVGLDPVGGSRTLVVVSLAGLVYGYELATVGRSGALTLLALGVVLVSLLLAQGRRPGPMVVAIGLAGLAAGGVLEVGSQAHAALNDRLTGVADLVVELVVALAVIIATAAVVPAARAIRGRVLPAGRR